MFLEIAIVVLLITTIFSGIRILKGPSLWDRLLGFSLVSSKLIIIVILFSLLTNQSFYLDIALICATLGFVGTTSISKLIRNQ